MNQVLLQGELLKAVQITNFRSGAMKTRGMLKVISGTSKEGKDIFDFVPFEAWNDVAEEIIKETTDGSIIRLKGQYKSGSYEKDGKKVYTHTINVQQYKLVEQPKVVVSSGLVITDDDLPF